MRSPRHASTASSWRSTTASVVRRRRARPAFRRRRRSASIPPRQRRHRLVPPPSRRSRHRASAAPNARRARIVHPNSASIARRHSPVYAPRACSLTFCAPQPIDEPDNAAWACQRYGNGTHTAMPTPALRCPARRATPTASASFCRKPAVHFPVADDELAAHALTPALPKVGGRRYTLKSCRILPAGPVGSTRCAAATKCGCYARLGDARELPKASRSSSGRPIIGALPGATMNDRSASSSAVRFACNACEARVPSRASPRPCKAGD